MLRLQNYSLALVLQAHLPEEQAEQWISREMESICEGHNDGNNFPQDLSPWWAIAAHVLVV